MKLRARLDVAIVEGIDKIPRDAWDSLLAPDDSPFVEWDWLHAMEHSGSAARNTGWAPYHLIVRQGPEKQIVAACPLYLKTHSMGEFVFDHGWADAAERAGIRYFPKFLVGVPFTPHTGRRFLTAPGADRAGLINLLGLALTSICEDNKLSIGARQFLRAGRSRRAYADRLHGTARLPVPLAQRGFHDLRRLSQSAQAQAAHRSSPRTSSDG